LPRRSARGRAPRRRAAARARRGGARDGAERVRSSSPTKSRSYRWSRSQPSCNVRRRQRAGRFLHDFPAPRIGFGYKRPRKLSAWTKGRPGEIDSTPPRRFRDRGHGAQRALFPSDGRLSPQFRSPPPSDIIIWSWSAPLTGPACALSCACLSC
jgi:hypothetical protein